MLTNIDLERELLRFGFTIQPPLRAYSTKFIHPGLQHSVFVKEKRKDGLRPIVEGNALVLHPDYEARRVHLDALPGVRAAPGYLHNTSLNGFPKRQHTGANPIEYGIAIGVADSGALRNLIGMLGNEDQLHEEAQTKESIQVDATERNDLANAPSGIMTNERGYDARNIENLQEDFNRALERSLRDDPSRRRARLATTDPMPRRVNVMAAAFVRNPDVVAEVLLRANANCESCGAPAPFKRASDGSPYLEVHHILPLAKNGKDTVDNAEALCPNCHRQKHFGTVS